MDTFTYTDSALWQRTLAIQGIDDRFSESRARLRISFEKTRQAVKPLVAKIAQELPGLTIHDVTHLDALWHIADTILGPNYPINPVEAYILGMTFLLHDAATSTFAFPKGIEGLKESVQWRDYVAQKEISEDALQTGTASYKIALFETLRLLHADQASKLPTQSWKDLDGLDRYLIEDVQLRNHYGSHIGRIAASHGSDIGKVEQLWAYNPPVSTHSSLNIPADTDWKADCLKLALALRCIDAAHIDSLRAPDFEAIFAQPKGESANHWMFQNKLGAIALNEKKELYWSSSAFDVKQSEAWWRCFETSKMIDREIAASNRILSDHQKPRLQAIGVANVQSIQDFQRNVPVEGWTPLDVSFKVSQVNDVVEKFGGKQLYGDQPHLALRELIQNSVDAIHARRAYLGVEIDGSAKIEIALADRGGEIWLTIQDNGIGMSDYVLTEVLLDFGRSLWKDGALRQQWAGLASNGFKPVGKYGIGFFSVFMLGDEVKVSTWRYGSELGNQMTLHLRSRTAQRPIIMPTPGTDRLKDFGTRVSIRLKNGVTSLLRTRDEYIPEHGYKRVAVQETLGQLVGLLAPALDIDLYIKELSSPKLSLHSSANDWRDIPFVNLLKRVAPTIHDDTLKRYSSQGQDIYDGTGTLKGRACISLEPSWSGRDVPCTLIHQGVMVGTCKGMAGVLIGTNNSDLARGSAVPELSGWELKNWAESQVNMQLGKMPPMFAERANSLGVARGDLIVGSLNAAHVSIDELIEIFGKSDEAEMVFLLESPECPYEMAQEDFDSLNISEGIVDLTDCTPRARFDFGLAKWVNEVLPEVDSEPRTIVGTLQFLFSRAFDRLEFNIRDSVIGEANGVDIEGLCFVISKMDT